MEKKYSFWERITSDTPKFFRRAQVFGLGLATLGGALSQNNLVPTQVVTALISVGTAVAAIAQFAVKQCEPEAK